MRRDVGEEAASRIEFPGEGKQLSEARGEGGRVGPSLKSAPKVSACLGGELTPCRHHAVPQRRCGGALVPVLCPNPQLSRQLEEHQLRFAHRRCHHHRAAAAVDHVAGTAGGVSSRSCGGGGGVGR